MNPIPPDRPQNPPPRLVDQRTTPSLVTSVALTRGVAALRLPGIERAWEPGRAHLAAILRASGHNLESGHWDWRNKMNFYPHGWHCFVAVEAEGEVQGLMAVETGLRPSALDPTGWVVYVDFIEAAPWNRREPAGRRLPAIQTPRYSGVGTLLLGEAVRMSMGRTANGRVGLHSLPSAEEFYSVRCGMTRVGPDSAYHDLVYFEYPDGVASEWLTAVGFSA